MMNRNYRLVFNQSVQMWQAVAEFAKACGKSKGVSQDKSPVATFLPRLKKLAVCIALGQLFVASGIVYALPSGADVQFGQATFQTTGNNLSINQGSRQLIANWQSFGIASNESVQLLQPNQGVALFRVVGPEASQIYGSLNATGSLFLVNPNGVLFGQGAQVDVGSLVATSMNISNADFLGGRYQFNADAGTGSVVNQGVIKAADGGYIVLLGNEVKNSGTLTANNGSVVMGSAQSAMLDFYGNGLVKAKLSGDALNALVEQTGTIQADGGAVQLATNSRSSAVNVSGIVQANSLVERNGVIRLEGGDNAKVSVSGILSATGNQAGSTGGNIEVTGEQVALFKGANLDASGDAGGGTVLVGGDYQGKNSEVYNSRTTYVDKDASIHVDANNTGNGGKAIVWADEITRYYGNISAKGGANSGNGGFVEVSGKQALDFIGRVDLSARNGIGGQFLLDPTDITFNTTTQASPPNNANGTPDLAFGDGPANTIVQISDIVGFSEAFFQATNNITIANALTMNANNSIRLEAGNNINVNAAVTTSGTGNIRLEAISDININAAVTATGTGSVRVIADSNTNGFGDLVIGGNITSRAGGITIAGATILRFAGNIAATGAANGNAGNISISSSGLTNLGAATITANGGTAGAGTVGRNGGAITINTGGFTTTGAISANGSNGNGANQTGGNAGSVAITSSNGISVGAITSSGGNAGTGIANGGNAGTITLINNTAGNIATGALTARNGNAIGTGAGGAIGSINVTNNASGSLTTGALSSAGANNGNGGTISLTTASGNITTTTISSSGGTALTGNAGRNAGAININSGGTVNTTTVAANGSAGVGTSQNGGNAANVSINATTGITTTTIAASGGNATATNGNGGNAGSIGLTNNSSGNITTTTITARNGNATGTGSGGSTGAINVTNNAAVGNVTTTALSTQGGTLGHGGSINVSALGNVSVNGTTNSAGGTSLTGNAGRNAGSVSINAGGNVVVSAITSSGSAGLGTNQNGGSGAVVTLSSGAGSTITHNNITASGGARTGTGVGGNGANVNVNGNSLLSANTTIATTVGTGGVSSGNVTFGGTINSSGAGQTLAINTTAATTLNGAIGNTLALTSLTTNAGGTTTINGGSVTTTGVQTYNDAVTLGVATNLNTTNSAITFANSVNASGNNLMMATGSGNITATNATNNFANVAITSANNVSLRDVNALQLGTSNVTGTYNLQSAGAVTQTGAVTVGGATSITAGAGNDVTLNNTGNNFNSVAIASGRDVSIVDANALTVNASTVRTMTAQTLSGDLTLGGAITATGTGSGSSVRLAAAQNFINTGNFGITPGAGSRWLVYSTSPISDTRGAGLITASNFKQYNTTFPGSISGTGNGFVYSVAPTITASLSGTATKTYDGTTTAPIGGLTLGQSGAIDGDTVNLSAFTSATYNDKNAGTGKTVTSNALSITGATNGGKQVFGYTLASPTASGNVGTINQRAITVSAATDTKTYDGNTSSVGAPTLTSGSIVLGDTGSFSQTFDNRNAGTGKTLTASGSVSDGNGGNNYAVTFAADNTGVINQRAISVTANAGQNKVFGAADPLPFAFTVGGLGLVAGDAFTGALDRIAGETVGNYAINQGTLDAGTNYTINYIGSTFAILAPGGGGGASGNGSPRDAAGLGSLLAINDRPTQSLAILNVAAPGAGDETDTENAAEACEANQDKKLNNPNTSIIFNFGIKLPKGVKPVCI